MPYVKGQPDHWTDDMTDTITVYAPTTLDNYGKQSTSESTTTYIARVVSEANRSRDNEGTQIVEGGTLYIMSNAAIEIGSRLVLPGGREPVVLAVDKTLYSANGTPTVHHTVVKFGRS